VNIPKNIQRRFSSMTKKEKEYLEELEGCFEQLKIAYNCAQDKINELKAIIEILEKTCRKHSIEIPVIDDDPEPF
jgi:S-adenosylmethionine/arginine decarboxylase-like enzyme